MEQMPVKKCYTFRQIIFCTAENQKKNVHKPLRLLGSLPITSVHQMLHQCNIFKENSHETNNQIKKNLQS